MIRSYFRIMFRAMIRQKFLTSINILSLSAAITFAMLTSFFIAGELAVNTTLKDVDRLFLVQNSIADQPDAFQFFTPALLTKNATEQYPAEFSGYYRFWDRNVTFSKGDKSFRLQSMIGDSSFLNVFGFKVLHGDVRAPFRQRDCMIVTENAALKFFGETNVVNETLSISTEQNGIREYRITAVIAEPDDKNTVTDLMNMNAQVFLSLENKSDFFTSSDPDSWSDGIIAYVKLTSRTSVSHAEATLNAFLKEGAPEPVSEKRSIHLSSLEDYYLLTNHGAVLKLLVSLTVIVIFILILAITNFVNFSVANSFSRLKEVGIRKVIGSMRKQLISQFLGEAVMLVFIAAVLSLGLYQLLYSSFNSTLSVSLPPVFEFHLRAWIFVLTGVILIGIVAGAYPSLFQSGIRPIDSLKGKSKSVRGTVSFSRVLLTVQFAITVFIFTGAVVLSKQAAYFLDRDLGYNKEHVLIVYSAPRWWNEEGFDKMEIAKDQFLQSSKIRSVSFSWGAPALGMAGADYPVFKSGVDDQRVRANVAAVDENFAEVYQLDLIDGDFLFKRSSAFIHGNVVVNESAKEKLSVNIGDKLTIEGDTNSYNVAGIVQDFNYESMHEPVKPVIFMHPRNFGSYRFFSFNLEPGTPSASVAEVERLWKEVFPGEPFSYIFADDQLQALYTTELQLKKASTIASVLMLIIVMSGVIGLVSLNISGRNKEIGIRKVLGATIPGILLLFSKEYARLILISFSLAVPLSYYFADHWLQSFVYHIDLHWSIFVVPGILLIVITTIIVSIQSYRSAAANPVRSLRYE